MKISTDFSPVLWLPKGLTLNDWQYFFFTITK